MVVMSRPGAKSICCAVALIAWLCLALAARADTVYVSSEKDNTITVIDGDSLEVTRTLN